MPIDPIAKFFADLSVITDPDVQVRIVAHTLRVNNAEYAKFINHPDMQRWINKHAARITVFAATHDKLQKDELKGWTFNDHRHSQCGILASYTLAAETEGTVQRSNTGGMGIQ